MKSTYKQTSYSTIPLLRFLPLTLITVLCLFFHSHCILSFFTTPFRTHSTDNRIKEVQLPIDDGKFNIFFGIITTPGLHERRHLLRTVYAVETRNLTTAKVDVRFIICNPLHEDDKMFLKLETMVYGDIIILDCVENLNNGKTYTYFSTLPSLFSNGHGRPYDYVIKADNDAYFRLDNVVSFLKDKPRDDFFYGMEISCDYVDGICGVHNTFMAGFGYVLSWDLVEWIAESDVARNNKSGLEDVMLAKWLNTGGKGKNRYNGEPRLYDYKGNMSDENHRRDFIPETVAVHKLKSNVQWARALEYFNVTTLRR